MLRGAVTPEQAELSLKQPAGPFIISLIGSDLSAFAAEDPQALKTKVFLRPKKTKQKILADQAQLQRLPRRRRGSPDGKKITAAVFVFARTTATGEPIISADERGVEFGCELKSVSFKVQFDPRAMRVGEAPDM